MPIMDAESWTVQQHWQHSRLVQCRAAEVGKWFCVCSTSGITQIVDPAGQVVQQVPPMIQTTLRGTIYTRTGSTFFVKVGWLFPWIICGVAALWCLQLALKNVIIKPKNVSSWHPI